MTDERNESNGIPLPGTDGPKAPPAPTTSSSNQTGQKQRLRRILLPFAAVAVAVGAIVYYFYQRHFEETDDAQVDGDISNVSARVTSTVLHVHVVENQRVAKGDMLVELDPAPYVLAAERAKGAVAQAEAELGAEHIHVPILEASNSAAISTARADLVSARAQVIAAQKEVEQLAAQLAQALANNQTAQLDRQRSERLVAEGAISRAAADAAINGAAASDANVRALRQGLSAARERVAQADTRVRAGESRLGEVATNSPREVETRQAQVGVKQAMLDQMRTQLAEARLSLSYCAISAPVAGIVGRKAVSIGDHVAPGQQLLAISQVDELWVTANFRETQLEHLQPGQRAAVHVDAIDSTFSGTVESLGGATGARFSILPPENATGNFVKVVQRIPVRIRFDPGQAGLELLRPGMSVEPKVRIR